MKGKLQNTSLRIKEVLFFSGPRAVMLITELRIENIFNPGCQTESSGPADRVRQSPTTVASLLPFPTVLCKGIEAFLLSNNFFMRTCF